MIYKYWFDQMTLNITMFIINFCHTHTMVEYIDHQSVAGH